MVHPVFGAQEHEDLAAARPLRVMAVAEAGVEQAGCSLPFGACVVNGCWSLAATAGGAQCQAVEGSSSNRTGELSVWSYQGRHHLWKQEQCADSYSWL